MHIYRYLEVRGEVGQRQHGARGAGGGGAAVAARGAAGLVRGAPPQLRVAPALVAARVAQQLRDLRARYMSMFSLVFHLVLVEYLICINNYITILPFDIVLLLLVFTIFIYHSARCHIILHVNHRIL